MVDDLLQPPGLPTRKGVGMIRDDLLFKGTFAALPKAVLALPSSVVSPAMKLVFMAIVERMGEGKDYSFAGAGTLARDTGLSRKGAQKAIELIAALGLIGIAAATQEDGRQSNTYTLPQRTEFTSVVSSLANRVRGGSELSTLGGSELSTLPLANRVRSNYRRGTTEVELPKEPLAPSASGDGFAAALPPAQGDSVDECTSQDELSEANRHRLAASAPSSGGATKSRQPAKGDLSDAEKQSMVQSAEHLAAYFCFGRKAIGKLISQCEADGMMPVVAHWAPTSRNYATVEQGVGPAAVAAYAICRANKARVAAGLPIDPMSIPTMIGVLKKLKNLPFAKLIEHINTVAAKWPEIRAAIYKGETIPMNAMMFVNPRVMDVVEKIQAGQPIGEAVTTTTVAALQPRQTAAEAYADPELGHLYAR